MISVLCCIVIVSDHIVNNATVACESSKGFVHPAVIMLGCGGDPKGDRVLESRKWRDESSQELVLLIQWALLASNLVNNLACFDAMSATV